MDETVAESVSKAIIDLIKKIRVLHVDDDSGILKITKECLESEGPVQVESAVSVEEALRKLEKEKFDIVVSDYQMPGKDGLDLLKTLRSSGNTIPFIMFTGKGREDVAIRALNMGANRYLDKLGETETVYTELVQRITELTKTRKTEEGQGELEQKFRILFEKANDGLVYVDLSGNVLDVNEKATEIAGKRREDIVGKSLLDLGLVSSNNIPVLAEMLRKQATGPIGRFEFEVEKENGQKRLIEISSSPIQENNKPTGSLAIIRDITERKKAEVALLESEAKFRELVDRLPEMVFELDINGNVAFANKRTFELTGYSEQDLSQGFDANRLFAPEDLERSRENMKKILSGDSRNIDEYVFVRKDGTRFAVLLSSAPVVRDGKVVGLREIVVDVGERKKTDEVPRQSEDRYAMLSAAAFEAIGIFEQGKMVDANDQLAKMLGYELSELVGKDVLDFVAPESRDMVTETMRKGIEGPYEHLALRKGGSVFPVEVRTRLIQYKGRTAVVISIRDVTEEKKLEKSLWENGEKFAGLLSGSPEATVFTDSKMNIVEVNPRFVSLFGFKEEEVKGKRLNDVIVPENMTEEGRMLDSKAQEGYVYHETVRKRKDGSIVPVSVSAVPIVVKGSLVGNVAMYNDISKLKIADAAMKEMLQKMILANEKLRVVGGVTRHDVRNKLSTVLGNVYLLRKQGADAALLDKLKDMETAVHQVTQIFEFAKDYESLGVEELAYVDVGKDFEKAIGLFSDLKHAIITNNCTGLMVLADSLLKRLFYNLVDNSLKHGQKTSRIEIRYQEASRDELTLYYEDDGGGIPDETKPNLFKEGFTTGNGAGYGLYLVKKMTEVYGWAIMETGVPGKGAQFKITIPRINKKGKENYQIAPKS